MPRNVSIGATALAALSMFTLPAARAADSTDIDGVDLYVADQLTYDDNLFRLPDDDDELLALRGADARRTDYLHRITAGVDARWEFARQQLLLDARVDNNDYRRNSDLDHTARRGRAEWQWRLGSRWDGQLGGDYSRTLGSFANTRLLARDLIDTTGVYARANVVVGSKWLLGAGARHADIEHSARERRFDNAQIDTVDGSLKLRTTLNNWVGLAYRHAQSDNRDAVALGGADRSYTENASRLETHYEFSDRTQFDGGIGYLERDYDTQQHGFSGGVWDAALGYELSPKTQFKLSAWRKLRAYLDAESDYFVATGGSVGSEWRPTEKFGVTVEVLREERKFIAASANLAIAAPRRDRANAAELLLTYTPWRALQFDLTLRAEKRTSDRDELGYDDRLASLAVRFTI